MDNERKKLLKSLIEDLEVKSDEDFFLPNLLKQELFLKVSRRMKQ